MPNNTATITIRLNIEGNQLEGLRRQLTGLGAVLEGLGNPQGLKDALATMSKQGKTITDLQAKLTTLETKLKNVGKNTGLKTATEEATQLASGFRAVTNRSGEAMAHTREATGTLGQLSRMATQGLRAGVKSMTQLASGTKTVGTTFTTVGNAAGSAMSQINKNIQTGIKGERDLASAAMDVIDAFFAEGKAGAKAKKDTTAASQADTAAKRSEAQAIANVIEKETLLAAIRKVGSTKYDPNKQRETELKALATAIASVTSTDKAAASALAAYGKQVYGVIKYEDNLRDSMNKISGRFSYYEKQYDALFRASYRLQAAGSNLLRYASSVKNYVASFMNVFGEFQRQLNRAAGALSIFDRASSTSQVGTDALQNSVLDLSEKLRIIPAAEVAQAMYYWGSTTGSVVHSQTDLNNEIDALTPIMQAAVITGTQYEEMIKGVYSIIAQYYNGAVSAATNVTEKLLLVAQKTAAEVPDLINSFKMVGPIARANNETFDDLVQLFGQLADLGIRGTMAGRAFRQLFIQLVRPSKQAASALETLWAAAAVGDDVIAKQFHGKSYVEMVFPKGQFVGIVPYIDMLAKATDKLTQSERNHYLAQITTANELPVITALVLKAQRALHGLEDDNSKYLLTSAAAADYFEKSWGLLSNSWNGIVGALQRGWQALQITVGSAIADTLTPLIENVTSVVDKIREWAQSPANREIVKALSKVVAVGAALTGALGVILTATGSLIGLGAAVALVVKSLYKFTGVFAGIGTVVTGLIMAVVRNFDELRGDVDSAVKTIASALGQTEISLSDVQTAVENLTKPFSELMDIVVKGTGYMITQVANLAAALITLDKSAHFLAPLLSLLGTIFAGRVLAGMTAMILRVTGLAKAYVLLKTVISGVRGGALAGIAGGATTATKAVGGLRGALSGVVGMIGPSAVLSIGIAALAVAYESNFLRIKDGVNIIIDSFKSLDTKVKESQDRIKGMLDDLNMPDVNSVVNAATHGMQQRELAAAQTQLAGIPDQFSPPTLYSAPVALPITFSYGGRTYTGTRSEILSKIALDLQKDAESLIAGVSTNLSHINTNREAIGKLPIDPTKLGDEYRRLVDTMIRNNVRSPEQSAALLESLITPALDPGSSRDEIKKIILAFQPEYAAIADDLVESVYNAMEEQAKKTAAAQNAADSLWAPIVKQFTDLADANIPETEKRTLIDKFLESVGSFYDSDTGVWTKANETFYDYLSNHASPEVADAAVAALQRATGQTLEDIGNTDIGDPDAPSILSVADLLTNKIGSALQSALAIAAQQGVADLGVDITNGADLTLVTGGTIGALLADLYAGSFEDAGKTFSDKIIPLMKSSSLPDNVRGMLEEVAKTLFSEGKLTKDQLTSIGVSATGDGADVAKTIVESYIAGLTGSITELTSAQQVSQYTQFQSVFDRFSNDIAIGTSSSLTDALSQVSQLLPYMIGENPTITGGLSDAIKSGVQSLVENGIAGASSVLDQINGTAANAGEVTADEIISAYGGGLESGWKKSLRGLLRQTDKQKLKKLVNKFLDETLISGLLAKNNVGANKKAEELYSGLTSSIQTILNEQDPSKRVSLAQILLKQIKIDTKGKKLPKPLQDVINTFKATLKSLITPKTIDTETNRPGVGHGIGHGKGTDGGGITIPVNQPALTQALATAQASVDNTSNIVKAAFTDLAVNVEAQGGVIGQKLAAGLLSVIDVIRKASITISGAAENPLKMITALTWGAHVGQNLAAGLLSMLGTVHDASVAIAGQIVAVLQHTSPKEGPLAHDAMTTSGKHMMENLASGINQGSSGAAKAATNTADKITKVWIKAQQIWVKGHWGPNGDWIQGYWKTIAGHWETIHKKLKDGTDKVRLTLKSHADKVTNSLKKSGNDQRKALESQLNSLLTLRQKWLEKAARIRRQLNGEDDPKRRRYEKLEIDNYIQSAKNLQDRINKLRIRIGHLPAGSGKTGTKGTSVDGSVGSSGDTINVSMKTTNRILRDILAVERRQVIVLRHIERLEQNPPPQIVKDKHIVELNVNVSVKSDGTTIDRQTLSAIRKGVMEGITLSDLGHMITVS